MSIRRAVAQLKYDKAWLLSVGIIVYVTSFICFMNLGIKDFVEVQRIKTQKNIYLDMEVLSPGQSELPGDQKITEEEIRDIQSVYPGKELHTLKMAAAYPENFQYVGIEDGYTEEELRGGSVLIVADSEPDENSVFRTQGGIAEGDIVRSGDDSNDVVISSVMAEENGLRVGSKLNLLPVSEKGEKVVCTVKGIFQREKESVSPVRCMPANYIFTTDEVATRLGGSAAYKKVGYKIPGRYKADEIYEFVKEMNPEIVTVIDDSAQVQGMRELKNMRQFSLTLFGIIQVLGGVILGATVLSRMYGRYREAGVLMAIGEKKGHIIQQLLWEILLPAGIAFIFSFFTACICLFIWAEIHFKAEEIFMLLFFSVGIIMMSAILPLLVILNHMPKELINYE